MESSLNLFRNEGTGLGCGLVHEGTGGVKLLRARDLNKSTADAS